MIGFSKSTQISVDSKHRPYNNSAMEYMFCVLLYALYLHLLQIYKDIYHSIFYQTTHATFQSTC